MNFCFILSLFFAPFPRGTAGFGDLLLLPGGPETWGIRDVFFFRGRSAGGSAFAAQNWGQTRGADGLQIFCCPYFVCFLCFRAVPLEKEFAEARTEGRGKQQKKEKEPEEEEEEEEEEEKEIFFFVLLSCVLLFCVCLFLFPGRRRKKRRRRRRRIFLEEGEEQEGKNEKEEEEEEEEEAEEARKEKN